MSDNLKGCGGEIHLRKRLTTIFKRRYFYFTRAPASNRLALVMEERVMREESGPITTEQLIITAQLLYQYCCRIIVTSGTS